MKLHLLFVAAATTIGLGVSLARPEAAPAPQDAQAAPPGIHDAADALVARAKWCEELGLIDAAISSYAAAFALEDAHLPAQAALVRLSASPIVPAQPGALQGIEAPAARLLLEQERLRTDLDRLSQSLSAQDDQIRQLQSTLSDRGRAGPIVDRLDRTIIDLQRQVTQNENDIRRLQGALDRARSDIDRFRNSPR